MRVKIAAFNLENLFQRPAAMNEDHDEDGRQAIEDHALANKIVKQDVYADEDKETLIGLSKRYGWHKLNPPRNALVQLQKIRGRLFSVRQGTGEIRIVANGRADWTGWFELRKQDVTWEATFNTGRVIAETDPDILLLVEVESRPTFQKFNDQILRAKFDRAFPYFMVIDGNDDRGIDVGIASKFPIRAVRSHVDDLRDDVAGTQPLFERLTFSRDCPEYDVDLGDGQSIVLIPNHFKSKRSGNDEQSQKKRTAQSKGANAIATAALQRSSLVLIGGDLNDVPASEAIVPVFAGGFEDVIHHPDYPKDRPGTYGTGLANNKIDYLIMSPELKSKLLTAGIERRGSFHPNTWESFDTVTSAKTQASDHHLIWAEFEI
jgi:endonuclease/exonuclease/phosphatase family metal-dependent hydrolase